MADLNNLESELDENQKDFIYEYSTLQRKHKHEDDVKKVREQRRGSLISTNSLKGGFFSQDNLALSL